MRGHMYTLSIAEHLHPPPSNKKKSDLGVMEDDVRCNTLHLNTLQHATCHRNTLQHTATHCNTLQQPATTCNNLQQPATHFIAENA